MDKSIKSNSFEEKIDVSLSKVYSDMIDKLLKKGIYQSKGEIVREGLRLVFEKNGIRLADQIRDTR